MAGSGWVGQTIPDAKSVMLSGGLASLEKGRMDGESQAGQLFLSP